MDLNDINWEGLSAVLPKNHSHLTIESQSTPQNHLKLTLDRHKLTLEKWSPVKKWQFIYDLATHQLQNRDNIPPQDAISISNQIITTLLQMNDRGKARYEVK